MACLDIVYKAGGYGRLREAREASPKTFHNSYEYFGGLYICMYICMYVYIYIYNLE